MIEAVMYIVGLGVTLGIAFVCAQEAFDIIQRRAYNNKKKWDEENR